MLALERRIDGGLLLLADEEAQLADVHLRRRGLGVLLAYHPLWLRAGLEVVVGAPVPAADGDARRPRRTRAELEVRLWDLYHSVIGLSSYELQSSLRLVEHVINIHRRSHPSGCWATRSWRRSARGTAPSAACSRRATGRSWAAWSSSASSCSRCCWTPPPPPRPARLAHRCSSAVASLSSPQRRPLRGVDTSVLVHLKSAHPQRPDTRIDSLWWVQGTA